ncbi:GNAT family N-acetyltransferase [Niallia taxi]|uniref:GNAT family N-acetyltransferase n=1 Tax=Niallia taxi TaxID=2499688 RepID=UPI003982477A
MEIRKLEINEIKTALSLILEVFEKFEAPNYSQEGRKRFYQVIDSDKILLQATKGELCFWGSFHGGELTGVITTKGISHIFLLFVRAEYHRRGIAKALLRVVIDKYKSNWATGEITVNSSIYAKDIYLQLGFELTGNEENHGGLRFIPMSYII